MNKNSQNKSKNLTDHPISGVSMLILLEPDIPSAVAFYKQMGLILGFELPEAWAEFQLPGGIKLCLCPTQTPAIDHRTGIVLEVPDLMAFYHTFKDKVTFVGEPLQKVHGIMVGIKDPGGNIIDLYQPTPEKVKELVSQVKRDEQSS